MDRFGLVEGLISGILLRRTLLDSLFTERNFLLLRTFNSLVVRGRVRFTFQTRIISVKSGPGALLGRLEPRDLGGRVVDGLLELPAPLRS